MREYYDIFLVLLITIMIRKIASGIKLGYTTQDLVWC